MDISIAEDIFKSTGADALVTCAEDFRFYLTGFQSSFGIVITDADGLRFYTDCRYKEAAEDALTPYGIKVLEYSKIRPVSKLLNGYKTVAMNLDRITANDYREFISAGLNLVDSTPHFEKAMAVKRPEEIAKIKLACEATDRAFIDLLPRIRGGMTENEVAATLEYLMRKHGATGTSFETICAFGANASVPHHETDFTTLKYGDAILLDFGCKVGGYCSDCTRTLLYGDDGHHEEFKQLYNKVLGAHMVVKSDFKAGMTGKQGDSLARNYLERDGVAKYFTHALGHSLGVNVHEAPTLSPVDDTVFLNGMVFSDEPGIYIEGKLGIRIEDTVALENDRVVSLTNSDKNLIIL